MIVWSVTISKQLINQVELYDVVKVKVHEFLNNCGCLCRQGPAISLFSLIDANPGLNRMKYFSLIQRWHTPDVGVNGGALLTIFQLIEWLIL